jgi:tricorn protease
VGAEAAVGDYILAIDGVELRADEDPYRLLRDRADRPVTLTLNRSPSMQGARQVTFNPASSEENLVYLDWIEANRRRVDEMTGGRVGYIHIPNMGAEGIRESSSGTTRRSGRKAWSSTFAPTAAATSRP